SPRRQRPTATGADRPFRSGSVKRPPRDRVRHLLTGKSFFPAAAGTSAGRVLFPFRFPDNRAAAGPKKEVLPIMQHQAPSTAQGGADLGSGSVGSLLFRLALPAIVAQLINVLYNMVDRMYIGHLPEIGET